MKRAKILTTILAFVLGATTIIFGACTTSLTANCATLNLNKPRDVNATITAQITGAKADANNNNLATSPALGTVGADGTVSKTIYSYNSDGSQQPLLSTWGIGKIYFSKSTEIPVVFSVTVTNYTVGKKLEVKITEVDGLTELTSATSKLSSIATSNSVSAIASEASESAGAITPSAPVTATITYTLKNLNQAASTLPITLKVEIVEPGPPKNITPVAPTDASPNTQVATLQANNNDIYNLPCEATGTDGTTKYLLSWYSDPEHKNQVPYDNYTPSTPQTLYAKTSKYPLLPNSAITMFGNAITKITTTTADFAIPSKVGAVKVTTLQGCCYGNTSIKNVELPYRVKNISTDNQSNGAFRDCTALISITIPSSVTSIERYAFNGCTLLTSITISSSVTSIGANAFEGCTALINANKTTDGIFKLKDTANQYWIINADAIVTVADLTDAKGITDEAFLGCTALKSIAIPSSVTSIGDCAFKGCTALVTATFEANSQLTSIKLSVFEGCTALTEITIPSSITSIERYAFLGCTSLKSIAIPSSITSIGDSAFKGCSALVTATFEANSQLTNIKQSVFEGCTALTEITIPSSITSIGDSAFKSCTTLATVTFALTSQLTSIGWEAFNGCIALASITIPSSVTSIGWKAFKDCTALATVTFEANSQLTTIEGSVFWGCISLKSIDLPFSVTSIGDSAFKSCTALVTVNIFRTDLPIITLGVEAFDNCHANLQIFVPSKLLENFKNEPNWSTYSSQIFGRN